MRFVLSLLILAMAQAGFAQDLGQSVKFKVEDGKPEFSLFYGENPKTWLLSATFRPRDLSANSFFSVVSWTLFDSKAGEFITGWRTAWDRPAQFPGDIGFLLELTEEEATLATRSLPDLKVVFSVNHGSTPAPTHFVDLGAYCDTHPNFFINFDDENAAGCVRSN